MRTCTECQHQSSTGYCEFPLPLWVRVQLLSPMRGETMANYVPKGYAAGHDCPTFSPREEAQP